MIKGSVVAVEQIGNVKRGDQGAILDSEEVDGVVLLTVRFARSGDVVTVFPGAEGNVRLR